jgi:uncharacterized membrane protein HdeD (DUF308 family)
MSVGVLICLSGCLIVVTPQASLAPNIIFAGVLFCVDGLVGFFLYIRHEGYPFHYNLTLIYYISQIIMGLAFLSVPLIFGIVVPWFLGLIILIFCVYGVDMIIRMRKQGLISWRLIFIAALIGLICGILLIIFPLGLNIYVAMFLLVHGIATIFYGFNNYGSWLN